MSAPLDPWDVDDALPKCDRCWRLTSSVLMAPLDESCGSVCPDCYMHGAMKLAGYQRQRLGADWCADAWSVPGTGLYWVDDEDGNWSLVYRPDLDDAEVTLSTWDWSEVVMFIPNARITQ